MDFLFSLLNTYGVFVLLAVAILYPLFYSKSKREMLAAVTTIVAVTILTVVLKELFSLPRPFITKDLIPKAGLTNFSSFPSSHTALSFAAATNIAFRTKKLGIVLIILAAFVGVGRIVANVHYPIDILFGMIIGVVIAYTVESFRFPQVSSKKNSKIRV